MQEYLTGVVGLFFHTVQAIMVEPLLAFFLFLGLVLVTLGLFYLLCGCFGGRRGWR